MRLALKEGLDAKRCSAVPRTLMTSLAVHPGEATSGRLAGDDRTECSSLRRFK
jgi:hypothetical protein